MADALRMPQQVTAGDTLAFSRTLSDYSSADGWTLSYALVNASAQITFNGSADGAGGFDVEVAAATTAAWITGDYRFQEYATKGAERHTTDRGDVTIKPNLATATTLETRTDWEVILDQLIAAYKAMSNGEIKTATISHNDRTTQYRSLEELATAINKAQQQVGLERQRDRVASGLPAGNRIQVRF